MTDSPTPSASGDAAAGRFDWLRPDAVLLLLLSADALIVGLHLVDFLSQTFGSEGSAFGRLSDPFFSLEMPRGFSEAYQYLKFFWIALSFSIIWRRLNQPIFLAWGALFAYLAVDDLFEFHERVGGVLAEVLTLPALFGLRGQDFGELLVSAIAAGLFLPWIGFLHTRARPEIQARSRRVFALLLLLVFFGVAVDMAHVAVMKFDSALTNLVFVIAEDGGEMVAVSLIAWCAIGWLGESRRREGAPITRPGA